jgi:hypothetical protein
VTGPDEGLVEAFARRRHAQDHAHLKPLAECSKSHLSDDLRWAKQFLSGLAESGLYLTTKEN